MKITAEAHKILLNNINDSDVCVDATAGHGNDTLFLCNIAKKVYAFDIQEEAINDTRLKTKDYSNVKIIKDSHENMDLYINEKVKAFIFNLGYLPKGDKNITTKGNITIKALQKALNLLTDDGIILMVVYQEHDNCCEGKMIEEFLINLNQKEYSCIKCEFINQINYPPYLLIIRRCE